MKLLDANILLYAYDSSSAHHAVCREWLQGALNDDEPVGLPWQTSLAFIRISTNPHAVNRPLPVRESCSVVSGLLERPCVVVVEPGERFWEIFVSLVTEARVSGPLITDAVLAALAIEQGATVCSTDRDFRRFQGLTLIDPSASG
ncbi:MAG TPA: TA system VapC family ribonuclease toxin [Steroidobacteraceae bacterium]|nr:TA system VapC family ribonuclease toxin [Steroidobacteraceae bacterium]